MLYKVYCIIYGIIMFYIIVCCVVVGARPE